MKRSLSLALSFYLLVSAISAQQIHTQWRQFACGPGVKTIRGESAKFVFRDGTWKEEDRILNSIVTFSPDGYIACLQSIEKDGSAGEKTVYSYTPSSNRGMIENFDNKGKLQSRMVRIYEASGRESEQISYDADGDLRSRNVFVTDPDGKSETISYDAAGNVINRSSLALTRSGGTTKTERTDYDATGNVTRKSDMETSGLRSAETYQEAGRDANRKETTVTAKTIFDYTVDSHSSVVKSFIWMWDANKLAYRPYEVHYYTVTYY